MTATPAIPLAVPKSVPLGSPLLATDHSGPETRSITVGGEPPSSQPPLISRDPSDIRGWLELRIWAEMFYDAQKHRIGAMNRAERGGVFSDEYLPHTKALEEMEHHCELYLRRCYRRVVPAAIIAWQKASPGIGEKSLARLLGHLGHPVHATPHVWIGEGKNRELKTLEPYDRTVSQLRSYCGHGDPTRRRRQGMSVEDAFAAGSPICKTIVHEFLAGGCVKSAPKGTVYRDFYDEARVRYADHRDEQDRPWSLGHQDNAARRLLGKRILRDLWLACR